MMDGLADEIAIFSEVFLYNLQWPAFLVVTLAAGGLLGLRRQLPGLGYIAAVVALIFVTTLSVVAAGLIGSGHQSAAAPNYVHGVLCIAAFFAAGITTVTSGTGLVAGARTLYRLARRRQAQMQRRVGSANART